MTTPERIEQLVTAPPTVALTRRQRIGRAVSVLFALVATVALVLAIVGFYRIGQVASCTNTNLATRNAPSINDARAHIAFADNVVKGLTGHESKRGLTRQARAYARTLQRDQDVRQAHPLGRC